MRRWGSYAVMAASFGLMLGVAAQAQTPVGQPTSEGHPTKWQTIDKSLFDLVSDGYKLVTVAYDTSQTEPKCRARRALFPRKGQHRRQMRFPQARRDLVLLVLPARQGGRHRPSPTEGRTGSLHRQPAWVLREFERGEAALQ